MSARRTLRPLLGAVMVATMLTACANTPSRSTLVTKLVHVNGLTKPQASCIANGLYDGMPAKGQDQPAIAKLTAKELRAVAKPDNAGKVQPTTLQTLRDVVTRCVPSNLATGLP